MQGEEAGPTTAEVGRGGSRGGRRGPTGRGERRHLGRARLGRGRARRCDGAGEERVGIWGKRGGMKQGEGEFWVKWT